MAIPAPPHVQAAQSQLAQALQQTEGKPVDLVETPWAELEKSIIKVLGGPFQMNRPEHQLVALALAGAFAERLARDHQAFWFPNRDAPEGATLGFPDAVIMLSPMGAVMDALMQAQLVRLEQLSSDIRRSLAQVRFGGAGAPPGQLGPARLAPEDYQRLFDPGFMQFVVVDPAKVKSTLEARPDGLARDIRDALGRTQPPLPKEARDTLESQIVVSLQRLDASKALADQAERAPRLLELMVHLFATQGSTGSAPEEFWQDVVLPLLFIGSPASFPPLDPDDVETFKQGVDPLALFVDVVPYAEPAPEDGLLGAFDVKDVGLPHPSLSRAGVLRLLKVEREKVRGLLEKFDAERTRDTVRRFTAYLEGQSGHASTALPEAQQMLDAALVLLTDLKRALAGTPGDLCLRRLTEAEAASDPALAPVRKALQGGRIILV
jgi:hypothetical protein